MGSRLEKGSEATRKKIERHTFDGEEGEEYESSKFGGFSDYFRRKKIKLQNLDAELRSSSGNNPPIFHGIVAQVNGYTQPSLNDLHHMIVSHGGGFCQYLDGKTSVTHIIAANLTPKKAIEFKRYRIVKPAWVVDSVKAGKVLPWESYRVVDEGVGQRLIGFNDGKVVSQTNTQSRTYREQTSTSWYTTQVKSVANDIDDDGGALFPSTQPVSANGTESYLPDSIIRRHNLINTVPKDETLVDEPALSNPESFDVSSSLEDAMNEAEDNETAQGQPLEPIEEYEKIAGQKHTADFTVMVDTDLIAAHKARRHSLSISSPSAPKKVKAMTAEEHNALLLADPNVRKSSTANPDFLRQFYSESRLHHLSAWKADLKARLQQMAADKSLSQKPPKRRAGTRRYIMHVDFDSFFCAVSLKNAPAYLDKPAVVAHGSGTGSEIASCNYPARAFGVKNGMWMKKALELCPDIKTLPYDFPAYEEASRCFYEAILNTGGVVQSVSVDEALVDITSLCTSTDGGLDAGGVSEGSIWREQEKANEIGQHLRLRIKDETGCAVSVGIGGSILLAKVALRRAKPAGQYLIKPEEVLDFIGDLTVQDLPGVAYSIGGKLEEIGIKFVKDVRSLTKERLVTVLGPKTGEKIWDYSHGIDKTEVGEQVIRKSVSAEVNWGIRFISQPEAEEFVQNLCQELQKRLLEAGVKGHQLTVKIMRRAADAPLDPPKHLGHGKCDTFNKSVTLGVATNSCDIVGREAVSILRSYGFSPGELRGLGIQMTKLEPIKATMPGRPHGSQRRIAFTTIATGPKLIKEEPEDIDDPDSPRKPRRTPVHAATAVAKANEADPSTKKPLNLLGTQFIMPTQFDPMVLAELPQDIRSRLLAQSKCVSISPSQSPVTRSRSQSPAIPSEPTPFPSQLDPEVFAALPDDVKAEVLASYPPRRLGARAQAVLPQSPRKIRALPQPKKITTPTKKRTGLLFRGRNTRTDSHSTLTQSNFVTGKAGGKTDSFTETATDSDGAQSDLDPDFLAALPGDVRAEVLNEHRRRRLARHAGLGISSKSNKKRFAPGYDAGGPGQRKLRLSPRPPKPTFTTQNLSSLPDLRETLNDWYREFRDEGPHGDDVSAMERYLRRVVCEERDTGKAVGICKWLDWVIVDDAGESNKLGREAWQQALGEMKERVQEAVLERGRGRVEF